MLALQPSAMRRMAYAVAIAAASLMLLLMGVAAAEAQTRTLKLYHVHLKERTEITYKRGGRFLPEGLNQANRALRDWREHSTTKMDPHLLDMLWEVQNRSGTRDYIHIIGGYRSPGTNRMLRSRSSGVADNSLHTQGKAIDFFIPDVPLSRVRAIALQLQAGGVGYYPRSGSPFVHIDTGGGRYWPRMNRNQLAQIFPNGNTIYLPADGRPMPGHEQAVAAFNQRRSNSSVQMASARSGGPTILARLFGGGADEAEDEAEAQTAPVPRPSAPARRAPAPAPAPAVQVAAAQPARPTPPAQLPAGVPMPERNQFDTTARSGGSAPVPAAGIPEQREVAALDLARVPVPASARRPVAAPADEEAPVAATVEETLVAALEEPAPSAASAGQLAYVPMPSTRPAFESLLNPAPVPETAPVAEAEPTVTLASLVEPTPAPRLVDEVVAVDAAPEEVPELAEAQEELASRLLASLEAAPVRPEPVSRDEATPATGSTGKGGRVLSEAGRLRAAPQVVAVEEAIGRRVEVASLVTGLEQRALEARPGKTGGDNAFLVVDVPASMVAHAFAPTREVSASDRFSGSAVNFLPVHRMD